MNMHYYNVKQGTIAAAEYGVAIIAWLITLWTRIIQCHNLFLASGKSSAAVDLLFALAWIVLIIIAWLCYMMISAIRSCRWPTSSLRRTLRLPLLGTVCIHYHPSPLLTYPAQADSPSPFVAGLVAGGSCFVVFLWAACTGTSNTTVLGVSYHNLWFIFGIATIVALWIGFKCIDEEIFGDAW
jgi:hypothetical protein